MDDSRCCGVMDRNAPIGAVRRKDGAEVECTPPQWPEQRIASERGGKDQRRRISEVETTIDPCLFRTAIIVYLYPTYQRNCPLYALHIYMAHSRDFDSEIAHR